MIDGLPSDVAAIYDEARSAFAAGAYTAAVLTCRKLLMHFAVEKEAEPGATFLEYVNHLVTTGWAPPGSQPWVDKIRDTSNEANHELVLMDEARARELLTFLEMLFTFAYEFPLRTGAPTTPVPDEP